MTSRFFTLTVLTLIISTALACNQTANNANSPLMVAAREGKADVVQALLSGNDVNINLTDAQGNTPLIEASPLGKARQMSSRRYSQVTM